VASIYDPAEKANPKDSRMTCVLSGQPVVHKHLKWLNLLIANPVLVTKREATGTDHLGQTTYTEKKESVMQESKIRLPIDSRCDRDLSKEDFISIQKMIMQNWRTGMERTKKSPEYQKNYEDKWKNFLVIKRL